MMTTLQIVMALLAFEPAAVQQITALVASVKASGAIAPTAEQINQLDAKIDQIQATTLQVEGKA